jgi:hypothetical protein
VEGLDTSPDRSHPQVVGIYTQADTQQTPWKGWLTQSG